MEQDELSFKELVLKVQEYIQELLRSWKVIGLITMAITALIVFNTLRTPPVYAAKLTFMVNEDDGGGISGLSAILGQFGLGGGSRGKYNLDKILELSKSRKILQSALFETVEIKGNKDYLANYVLTTYDFHEKWEEDTTGLKDFLFDEKSMLLQNKHERKAFRSVYKKIIGSVDEDGLITSRYSKESGIMNLRAETESEGLSINLVNVLYDKLSNYYIQKTTEKQKRTLEVVSQKADSIFNKLESTEYQLAQFKDGNKGLISERARLKESRLQRDLQIYAAMLSEAVKNREIADFSYKNSTPFVQLIDAPFSPIKPQKGSLIIALLLGGILGGGLAVGFVLARKIYRDLMAS